MKVEKEIFAFDHAIEEEARDMIGDLLLDMLLLCVRGIGSQLLLVEDALVFVEGGFNAEVDLRCFGCIVAVSEVEE